MRRRGGKIVDDEITIEIQRQDNTKQKTKMKHKNKKSPQVNKKNQKAVKKTASKQGTSQENHNKSLKHVKKAPIQKIGNKTKKRGHKKLLLLILFLIILVLLLSSSLFNITTISVIGNNKLSQEEIISLSKIQKHTNLFKINKLQSIENIKENAYIENVSIKRKIPNEIQIEVEERIPKYMLQFADSYVYINNQGYMLEISNERIEVPILIGITTDLSNIKAGNRINVEDLKKMNMVINIFETASSNEIGHLITKIDISDDKNYTLILETEGKTVYLGDCSELNTRILYLKSILEQEKGISGELFLNEDLNEQKVHFKPSI